MTSGPDTSGHTFPVGSVFRAALDGRWGIAIGDVCGKGPEAAALTSLVRAGDALLPYTDGLTDARAPTRILDERGLADLVRRGSELRGAELAEYLVASATEAEDPRDDIALLVIELPRDSKAASQGELAPSSRP